jgi:hypothetical protein
MAAVNLPFLEERPESVHFPAPVVPPAGPGVANGGRWRCAAARRSGQQQRDGPLRSGKDDAASEVAQS